MSKLLHPDGQTHALFFPPGLPERKGSCAFASMRCLVNCLSYLTHNTVTDDTLQIFKEKTPGYISQQILRELGNKEIVEWFCWGDCLPEITEKVLSVMRLIAARKKVQCGFTRNKRLWLAAQKIPNTRIGFTEEEWDEVGRLAKKGLVAYPRYDTGETEIYLGSKSANIGSCGSSFMKHSPTKIPYEADCSQCYKNKRGCFTDFNIEKAPR